MSEDVKKDPVKQYLKQLSSDKENEILAALKNIPADGDHRVIPLLVNLLVENKSDTVTAEVLEIMNALKDSKSLEEIILALRHEANRPVQALLVGALWQSSLDATPYITDIMTVAAKGDYMTCVECLTVLENLNGPFNDEDIAKSIKILKDNMDSAGEKEAMLILMAKILQNYMIAE